MTLYVNGVKVTRYEAPGTMIRDMVFTGSKAQVNMKNGDTVVLI